MVDLILAAVIISNCSVSLPSCSTGCYVPPPAHDVMRCLKDAKDRGEAVPCIAPDQQQGFCAPAKTR